MSAQTIYSLTDTFWVAGLGADALAAIGFAFPFFLIQMALTSGLGVGGGSAISRRIGARDKTGVDNVALHTFVIMLTLTAVLTVLGLAFVEDLFVYSGAAGRTIELGIRYARVFFGGSPERNTRPHIYIYSGVRDCRSCPGNRRRLCQFRTADVLLVFHQKRYLCSFQVQFLQIRRSDSKRYFQGRNTLLS